jgi:methionyl-tRNA formyltransferase
MRAMRLCLFALTGFGNSVLAEVAKSSIIDEIIVFTREEKGKFPYYSCGQLTDLCNRIGIKAYIDQDMASTEVYELLREYKPDIMLVATFDKKIPLKISTIPRMGAINIHPSLLPDYRGPTPTHWAIINGESESGVTFHYISEDFDLGDILFQERTSIGKLIDGELRKTLANLACSMIDPFLMKYMNGELNPKPQNENEGSYYPKVTSKEGIILLKSGRYDRDNLVRGVTPYPGIWILG